MTSIPNTVVFEKAAISHTHASTVQNPITPTSAQAKSPTPSPEILGERAALTISKPYGSAFNTDWDKRPLPTPLKPAQLAFWLKGYNEEKTEFLVQGFSEGFKVGFSGEVNSQVPKNLKSAYDMPEVINKKIEKEILAGRIAGPFKKPPFKEFQCSPIGVVPKKDGDYRFIHHLSFPEGSSINDQIDEEWATVSYATIEDAINLVVSTCSHAFMAKTDVKHAFRTVPLHPSVRNLFLFHWENNFYVNLSFPLVLTTHGRPKYTLL